MSVETVDSFDTNPDYSAALRVWESKFTTATLWVVHDRMERGRQSAFDQFVRAFWHPEGNTQAYAIRMQQLVHQRNVGGQKISFAPHLYSFCPDAGVVLGIWQARSKVPEGASTYMVASVELPTGKITEWNVQERLTSQGVRLRLSEKLLTSVPAKPDEKMSVLEERSLARRTQQEESAQAALIMTRQGVTFVPAGSWEGEPLSPIDRLCNELDQYNRGMATAASLGKTAL